MRGLHKHIPTGKLVYLTSGQYEVNGRVSNFFSGNVFNQDGEMTDEYFGDYNRNGNWQEIKDYKFKIELIKSDNL
jgi:hypothetical protein